MYKLLKKSNIIIYDSLSLNRYNSYSKIFQNIYVISDITKIINFYEGLNNTTLSIDAIIINLNDEIYFENIENSIETIRNLNNHLPIILNFSKSELFTQICNIKYNVSICYNQKDLDKFLIEKIYYCIKHYNMLNNIKYEKHKQQKHLDNFNNVAMVSITDTNGKITYVNDKFCEHTGYDSTQIIGKTHNIFKHPETSKEQHLALWNSIKKGISWEGKFKNLDINGNTFWIKSSILPIFDKNTILEYMSISFIITEEELQKKDKRKKSLKTIINNKQTIYCLLSRIRELENNLNDEYIFLLKSRIAKLEYELQISKQNESNSVSKTVERFRNIQDELHKALKEIKQQKIKISNLISDINKKDETISYIQSKVDKSSVEIRNLTIANNNLEVTLNKFQKPKLTGISRFLVS